MLRGTQRRPARSMCMAGSRRKYSDDGLAAAPWIPLCLYCAVAGCFALGLYALLQPARHPNPGLVAYKPPPATVISYGLPPRLRNSHEPLGSVGLANLEPETTGRSMRQHEPQVTSQSTKQVDLIPAPVSTSPKQTKKVVREVITEYPTPQRSACIPAYDSSGAQTRPC